MKGEMEVFLFFSFLLFLFFFFRKLSREAPEHICLGSGVLGQEHRRGEGKQGAGGEEQGRERVN